MALETSPIPAVDAVCNADARLGKYLSFILDGASYAVSVLKVREIIRFQQITPLPQMPDYVRGVINLRGKVIPVVSLARRLGLNVTGDDERTCIMVVQVTHATDEKVSDIGFVVDQVDEVFTLEQKDFEEPPAMGGGMSFTGLVGVAKIGETVRSLLDMDTVMGRDELAQVTAVA
jgi:purine-binding chemotaxis protein CheW